MAEIPIPTIEQSAAAGAYLSDRAGITATVLAVVCAIQFAIIVWLVIFAINQIKDSENKRRADGVAQFAKMDTFIEKLLGAVHIIDKAITELRITVAGHRG